MIMYKVGDNVTIKDSIEMAKLYGELAISNRSSMANRTVSITRVVLENYYCVSDDLCGSGTLWVSDMFVNKKIRLFDLNGLNIEIL